MPSVRIRDMNASDEYFVGTCTHEGESGDIDGCAGRRLQWLRGQHGLGLRVKVALVDDDRVGFLYVMPIEHCPWGPIGRDLLDVPCLFVTPDARKKGIGRELMAQAEAEAMHQGKKGVCSVGYYHDFWFMPAPFFEAVGYAVATRKKNVAVLWKVFDISVQTPRFLEPKYTYRPEPGKVVVDLFWHTFCGTSELEAQNVRDVVDEFGDRVVLNEYCADNRETFTCYERPRGIFINGKEIGWGYEAPRDGIRDAIRQAMGK